MISLQVYQIIRRNLRGNGESSSFMFCIDGLVFVEFVRRGYFYLDVQLSAGRILYRRRMFFDE